jgi:hypothetical protein
MLAAVTVFVVISGDPTDDAFAGAIQRALQTSLGAESVVVVRRSDDSETALVTWASNEHAGLLGIVTWSNGNRRATIRFVQPSDGHWGAREIRFETTDAPVERGRTVGFTLASIVPDELLPRTPPPPPPPPPPPRETTIVTTTPVAERPVAPPREPRPPGRTMLEAAAQGASGIGGYGGGIGGVFAVRVTISDPWQIRVGLGARTGDIAPASATSRVYFGGVGIAWAPWLDAGRRWSAGIRAEALLIGHDVVHFDPDDTSPVRRFRLLPGGAAAVEGSWRFADQAAITAAGGVEVAFGRTDVFSLGQEVAEIVPVRGLLELGLRVSF